MGVTGAWCRSAPSRPAQRAGADIRPEAFARSFRPGRGSVLRGARAWVVCGIVVAAAGCRGYGDKYVAELTHEDPAKRARAAAILGQLGRRDAVPGLIVRLRDEDREVRWSAVWSLRHLSGRHFGYEPRHDPATQTDAILRWQRWWERQGSRSPGLGAEEPERRVGAPRRVRKSRTTRDGGQEGVGVPGARGATSAPARAATRPRK